MGLEAEAELVLAGQSVHVRALLESHELILRGAIKKTFRFSDIANPQAINGQLVFETGGEPYALTLPDGQAEKWLKKLTTEPPSLAQKLGIDAAHKALVYGVTDDPAVAQALKGVTTFDKAEAAIAIAIALTPPELAAAIDALIHALPHAPLWVIYPKGAKSALPESEVRSHMKVLGYSDTKVAAVSEKLTATRFSPRRTVLPPTR
ncbi:MAG: hypothetical protein WDN06_09540 [Asticcacaulis sp.]